MQMIRKDDRCVDTPFPVLVQLQTPKPDVLGDSQRRHRHGHRCQGNGDDPQHYRGDDGMPNSKKVPATFLTPFPPPLFSPSMAASRCAAPDPYQRTNNSVARTLPTS